MSHERYTLEQRTKNHWRNPEWEALSGRENRMKGQFSPKILTEDQFTVDEVTQLKNRGAEFPLEVNEAPRAVRLYTDAEDFRAETVSVRPQIFPYATGEGIRETK